MSMGEHIRDGDPWFYCTECGARRTRAHKECTCEPFKAEFELTDDIARITQRRIMEQIEELCRNVKEMGWGYRLAVRPKREELPKQPFGNIVTYSMEWTILIPGQEVPAGEWTVYSPWLAKDKED